MKNENNLLALSVSLIAMACNHETSDPNISDCVDIPGVEMCGQEGDSGETGDTATSGETGAQSDEMLPIGKCVYNHNDLMEGYRYQCEGQLFASIDFEAPQNNDCQSLLGDFCSEHHVFAPPDDKYESPAVMACCGEYDMAVKDTYLGYCSYDLISQVCISFAKRIEKHIQDGSFSIYSAQASSLQQWVAQNYEACFDALLANDSNPAPNEVESFWSIPNSQDWGDLHNTVLTIDSGTIINNLGIPADPNDWLSCNGADDNDDEVFEGAPPPSGGTIYGVELATSVDGGLSGPTFFGSAVSATTNFDPRCAAKGCSNAEFWTGVDSNSELGVEEIEFFSDSFGVTNDAGTLMIVESARIVLYDRAVASTVYDVSGALVGYEIPIGEAYFLLIGAAADQYDHYLASNSSPIMITQLEGVWSMSSFDIHYADQSGALWEIEIGVSNWTETMEASLW